jgi:hypothetical protein
LFLMARGVVASCVLATVLATGASASPSATTTVYRDTQGENPDGPDITTVNVWSDGYRLAFKFPIPTSPVVTPDMRIRIWLDADDSLETGLTFESGTKTGLDHFVIVDPTRFPPDAAVLYGPCAGSTCFQSSSGPVAFTYASGASFSLDAPALGLKRIARLRFSVSFYVGIGFGPEGYDFTNARLDFAPDLPDGEGLAPMWTFDAHPLAITGFRATPTRPHAGVPFALTMRVQRPATGAAVTRGDVACALRIGGKRVPARTSRFVGRVATCGFVVPAGTEGRRYRATITVAAEGSTVTRSVSGHVG